MANACLTYSEKASYAHVLCTTSSDEDQIAASMEPVFDSDHTSVVFTSNVSDDITFTADAGTFTFSRAGIYHVVLTLVTSQVDAGDGLHTTEFKIDSDVVYAGLIQVGEDEEPYESTHQRIISVAADEVLSVNTKTSAQTAGIVKGTSIVITEITSGVYASSTVSTAGTNDDNAEFNPYDTSFAGTGDGPVFGSDYKIASGVTWTGTAGSMTVPSDGKYLIMVNNVYKAGGATNSAITMKLYEGVNVLHTSIVKLHSVLYSRESTICVIEDLSAGEVLTVTWDIGGAGGQVRAANKGATFTVIKLQEGQPAAGTGGAPGGYQSAYACVVNKVALAATAEEVNPFDEGTTAGGAGSADFDTRASYGITYDQSDGTFTVHEDGLYFVMHNSYTTTTGDSDVTFEILVNGVAQVTMDSIYIDTLPDPMNNTNSGFLELQRDDAVTVTIDAAAAVNLTHGAGSTLTILRYYGFFSSSDRTAADGLINNDFTIDTFSQGNLSAQYDRNIVQVPFKLGVRGVGTLRGRCTQPTAIKLGDKKN